MKNEGLDLKKVVKTNVLKKTELFEFLKEHSLNRNDVYQTGLAKEIGVSLITINKWLNEFYATKE